MKKKLHPTSQFKKDFKRIEKYPEKVAAFEYVANLLMKPFRTIQEVLKQQEGVSKLTTDYSDSHK